MNKHIRASIFLSLALNSFNAFSMGHSSGSSPAPSPTTPPPATNPGIREKYSYVDPSHLISARALDFALSYYDARKSRLSNSNYLTVIDFTLSSARERFFLIDMRSGAVETYLTAHGAGSDSNNDGYATVFSNEDGTHATALGFYQTAETYDGSHGYSLKLDGLSSTNSHARARAIVIHGADYVQPGRGPVGRSWGCPALDMSERTRVINKVKGGSLIFAYHERFSNGT